MTPDEVLERRLERLPRLAPDPERAARVKARCRAQVHAQAQPRRRRRREAALEFVSQVLAPAAVGGICVVYVAFLVVIALELGTFDHPLH